MEENIFLWVWMIKNSQLVGFSFILKILKSLKIVLAFTNLTNKEGGGEGGAGLVNMFGMPNLKLKMKQSLTQIWENHILTYFFFITSFTYIPPWLQHTSIRVLSIFGIINWQSVFILKIQIWYFQILLFMEFYQDKRFSLKDSTRTAARIILIRKEKMMNVFV